MICHGIPDRRPLEDGDIVNVDVTAYLNGFHGDLNETYIVGTVDDASRRLISVTSEVRTAAPRRQAQRVAYKTPDPERARPSRPWTRPSRR